MNDWPLAIKIIGGLFVLAGLFWLVFKTGEMAVGEYLVRETDEMEDK